MSGFQPAKCRGPPQTGIFEEIHHSNDLLRTVGDDREESYRQLHQFLGSVRRISIEKQRVAWRQTISGVRVSVNHNTLQHIDEFHSLMLEDREHFWKSEKSEDTHMGVFTLLTLPEVFPIFQHEGVEFIYMLQGIVVYRHADTTYRLSPGDSLFFDADAPHGPEELVQLPVRFLSIITNSPQQIV